MTKLEAILAVIGTAALAGCLNTHTGNPMKRGVAGVCSSTACVSTACIAPATSYAETRRSLGGYSIKTPEGVPSGWAWEEKGQWYRSPDRKILWVDGKRIQSIEALDSPGDFPEELRIKDHELIPWGSSDYSPRLVKEAYSPKAEPPLTQPKKYK